MEDTMMAAKAALATFFSTLGVFLGWQGIMAAAWVGAMALDYVSGTLAAWKAGQWSSKSAREGIWHKCGMIVVVIVSGIGDGIMAMLCANLPLGMTWPGMILPLVLAWYVITELGSILENAVKLGAQVPDWLLRLLKAGLKAVNDLGDSQADSQE